VFDAMILAGGSARRLDGADKPAVDVDGQTLLDRAVAAAKGAERIVIVGPRRDSEFADNVEWLQEDPPGGGPVAAIAAALPRIGEDYVLVLAADLPWIAAAVPFLLSAATKTDVAVLTDQGRRQYLAAVWDTVALRAAVDGLVEVRDVAAHTLYVGKQVTDVPDQGNWSVDCDTWDDIEAARTAGAQ
jgi:molybdopterin-guanine dinucleotide biosynthesis protein A